MENLLGFEGFEIGSTRARSTLPDVVKDLSEEEWDWVEMGLEEVKALKKPLKWNPKFDPRPDWRIQEIQNQNQIKNQNQTKNPKIAWGGRVTNQANLSGDKRVGWCRGHQTTNHPVESCTRVSKH